MGKEGGSDSDNNTDKVIGGQAARTMMPRQERGQGMYQDEPPRQVVRWSKKRALPRNSPCLTRSADHETLKTQADTWVTLIKQDGKSHRRKQGGGCVCDAPWQTKQRQHSRPAPSAEGSLPSPGVPKPPWPVAPPPASPASPAPPQLPLIVAAERRERGWPGTTSR